MECLRQQSNVKMLCSKQHCAFKFHVINGQNMYDQIMSDKMSKRVNQIMSDGSCLNTRDQIVLGAVNGKIRDSPRRRDPS